MSAVWTALPSGSKMDWDVAGDSRFVVPDVGDRQGQVLGEGSRPVDAHAVGIHAEVAAAGQAVAALAADQVPFAADDIADLEVLDVASQFNDSPHEFVSDHHRDGHGLLGPGVPVVDVYVRSADSRTEDFDEDVVDPDLRHGYVFQGQAGLRFRLDQRFHGLHHGLLLAVDLLGTPGRWGPFCHKDEVTDIGTIGGGKRGGREIWNLTRNSAQQAEDSLNRHSREGGNDAQGGYLDRDHVPENHARRFSRDAPR